MLRLDDKQVGAVERLDVDPLDMFVEERHLVVRVQVAGEGRQA